MTSVDHLSGSLQFLEPQALSDEVAVVIDKAARLSGHLQSTADGSNTDEALDGALREVEIDGLEYRRTMEAYGYDLLVAQTAGSTEDQERLYVFESGAFRDAQSVLGRYLATQCQPSVESN